MERKASELGQTYDLLNRWLRQQVITVMERKASELGQTYLLLFVSGIENTIFLTLNVPIDFKIQFFVSSSDLLNRWIPQQVITAVEEKALELGQNNLLLFVSETIITHKIEHYISDLILKASSTYLKVNFEIFNTFR